MKDYEKQFLIDVYNQRHTLLKPRDLINVVGFYIPPKRAWYLLEKWTNKGLYDYGVSLDLGWITKKGIEVVETIL